ncbi:hypothetical protein BJ878DRAFT_567671 [Calycina marina]|uniref:Uncharacterized protein n=1 Tax=Calycina marina TaxID=1763456 RepID=A0A9P7Z3P7_9HELO|nr:hypothetical protein BJ878DRAFT_567671 [Calycina marina]
MQSRSHISKLGGAFKQRHVSCHGLVAGALVSHILRSNQALHLLGRCQLRSRYLNTPSQNARNHTSFRVQEIPYIEGPEETAKPAFLQRSIEHAQQAAKPSASRSPPSFNGLQLDVWREASLRHNLMQSTWSSKLVRYRCASSNAPGDIKPADCTEMLDKVSVHHDSAVRMKPRRLLIEWLQLEDIQERSKLWLKSNQSGYCNDLSSILVEYLHNSDMGGTPDDRRISSQSWHTIMQHNFTMDDIKEWARIVSIRDPSESIKAFISGGSTYPIFILDAILQSKDITHVKTLDKIVIYTATQIRSIKSWQRSGSNSTSRLLRHTNIQIIIRLLYHARNVWSSALPAIAQMIPQAVTALLGEDSVEKIMIFDTYTHRNLCELLNFMLKQLATPHAHNTFQAMVYAWDAQRVLLGWAGQFEPPLLLSQRGYQAVSMVLAGQKSSEKESRVSALSTRTWPPWRVEQDGMDAKRRLEDDYSRVLSSAMRMSESGYCETATDTSMRILGGQESDGTPTILTRTVRRVNPLAHTDSDALSTEDTVVWAARVEATRDVQEAWSAFTKFEQLGGRPDGLMYFIMFEKLQAEKARLEFDRTSYGSRRRYLDPVPGGGKELLPPSNDNVSNFYRMQLQPPPKEELYDKMIRRDRIRPTGSFLRFMVANSRTPDDAILYLKDARIDPKAIAFLVDGEETDMQSRRQTLPDPLLASFLQMLCRFVPRINPDYQHAKRKDGVLQILELQMAPGKLAAPLSHAIELLKQTKSTFRPAWYAVFRALARRGTVVDKEFSNTSKNDILTWQITEAVLGDFLQQGLELDAYGFLVICNSLEKTILASITVDLSSRLTAESSALRLVAVIYKKLSAVSSIKSLSGHPELLHDISAVHLHAYVRVLGLAEDYEGITRVLEWMKEHHRILDERAHAVRNGEIMIRRTLTAMRVFTSGTAYRVGLEEIADSCPVLGWPSEKEADEYLERWENLPEKYEQEIEEHDTEAPVSLGSVVEP